MEKRWGKWIAARASLTDVCCRARDQGGQTWGGTNVTTQSDPSDCGSALTAPDSRSRANTRFGFSTSPVLAGRTAERLNVGVLWAVACPHSLALPGWFPLKRLLRRRYLWRGPPASFRQFSVGGSMAMPVSRSAITSAFVHAGHAAPPRLGGRISTGHAGSARELQKSYAAKERGFRLRLALGASRIVAIQNSLKPLIPT